MYRIFHDSRETRQQKNIRILKIHRTVTYHSKGREKGLEKGTLLPTVNGFEWAFTSLQCIFAYSIIIIMTINFMLNVLHFNLKILKNPKTLLLRHVRLSCVCLRHVRLRHLLDQMSGIRK